MFPKTKKKIAKIKISPKTVLLIDSIKLFITSIVVLAISLATWTKLAELDLMLLYNILLFIATIFAIRSALKPTTKNSHIESSIVVDARTKIEGLRKAGVAEEVLKIMEMPVNIFYSQD